MNKKKLLIISVLTIFVIAMSISTVSASKTKTKTFKMTKKDLNGYYHDKNLKNGDTIGYIYSTKSNWEFYAGVNVQIKCYNNDVDWTPRHTKLVKVKVWYKKNGKIVKKSSRKKWRGYSITVKPVKGYKPYKFKVWYKTY